MKTQTIWFGLSVLRNDGITELAHPDYERLPVTLVDGVATSSKVSWPAATSDWGMVSHVGIYVGPSRRLGSVWLSPLANPVWVGTGSSLEFASVKLEPVFVELIEFLKGKESMAELKAWIGLLDANCEELKGAGYDRIQIDIKDGVCRHPAVVFPPALDNWGTATYLAFYPEKGSAQPVAVTLFNSGTAIEVTSQTVIQVDNFQCDPAQLEAFERELEGKLAEPPKPIEVTGEMSAKFTKMDELLLRGVS